MLAWWNRNNLPQDLTILPATREEPRQTGTDEKPFDTVFNGVNYRIEPEFAYDLTGLVVSYRHHEGNSRMHRRARDHLNMLDVCVVWGDNAGDPALQKIDFWNGIFTCNAKTNDRDAWNAFDMHQLSNNHLISDDESVRKQVRRIAIGDQVRVRGFLAAYGNEPGAKRGTSTTRLDSGDGACETVYVEQFQILKPVFSAWRLTLYVASAVLLLSLIIHFRRPFRPYSSSG